MAGLIKKQILKHLSRFAKNLSPDKINLSTLKGEGQLTNLELDEEVLQNMLDLPTWLAINKVGCNKASIRIPWTKLKTHPISLSLDKVVMEMSTCDEPRPPNGPSPIATASGQSEYGFAEKVVEGISLSINSIVIRISAKAFNASFELSQLQVYSVNTSWTTSDLRFTRILDPQRGEILTFKEISWQMIRIEADAIQSGEHEVLSAPIRLITNQSRIRITLKRRMKDCNVVASKLVLILDDLLWVLTDSQLKAMVQYAKSLSEAMERSAQQRKSTASETSEGAVAPPSSQQVRAQQTSVAADQNATIAKLFTAYDVRETSHHLQIAHLDLHICDDIHAKDRVINKRITGGAMQLSFSFITMDYYPFHRAGESCLHWMHYSEATKSRESWARSLLDEFKSNVEMLKSAVRDHQSGGSPPQSSPQHASACRPVGQQGGVVVREPDGGPEGCGARSRVGHCCCSLEPGKISTTSTSTFSTAAPPPKTQLMSSSIVLRMADFSIYQVSTAEQRRSSPKAMISCNKKSLYLPQEMPAIHVEFTEYYFPDGKDYPIPCPNLYVQLNALQLVMDPRSLIWLNQFVLDLRQSLEQFMELYKLDDSQKPDDHVDIKVDGLMLKLVVPTDKELAGPPDGPRSVSIQTSEMVATNTRHPAGCTRSSLEALLQDFQEEALFARRDGPDAFPVLHPVFQRHAHEQDTRLHDIYRGLVPAALAGDALKPPAAADLWALHFSQFWVDYEGTRSGRGRPVPCVDSFPLSVWTCQPARHARHQERLRAGAAGRGAAAGAGGVPRSESAEAVGRLQRKRLLKEYYSSAPPAGPNGIRKPCSLDGLTPPPAGPAAPPAPREADVQVLVHVQKHLSVQVSHQQYVFLLRLQQSIRRLQQTLQEDTEQVGARRQDRERDGDSARPFGVCVGVLLKSAEVALLLRPVPQGDASPLGSDLSPSESAGTLGAGGDGAGPAGPPGSADELLCGGGVEGPAPLRPSPSVPDGLREASSEKSDGEESQGAGPGRRSSSEEKRDFGEGALDSLIGEEQGGSSDCRAQQKELPQGRAAVDPPIDPLTKDLSDSKDKPSAAKMPQSMSSGRLLRDRSQSSFSVSYKNLKKSPSLHSLDNISIDSCLLEDCDTYSLLERDGAGDDLSMSGFKDVQSDQSGAESANEALGPNADGGASPDTVSATSQSIDEPTKDLVSVLVLKVHSVCGALEVQGDSTAVSLEVGQVVPTQLGNVSVRQYLSNRSLGAAPGVSAVDRKSRPEVQVRLESGPRAAARSPLAAHSGFLQCQLQGFRSDFLMSSLRNLGHFLQDDSASHILPMKIDVSDMHVSLKDDAPRDNPSDPEPTPITLHIDNLVIYRQDDGSFSIGVAQTPAAVPDNQVEKDKANLAPDVPRVAPDAPRGVSGVSQTTQTTPQPLTSHAPSPKEKLLVEENECLKLELSRAKMALAEAQMEKDSLVHRMKSLKLTPGGSN
ncbi:UHRF1-binding protein 1-like isoform X2 [Anguilla rostrata]|uniref:UHRF1-binding protein 1-like isoform X2 n=1 Tax=Anguilla rostrata TaxID=7938 RepID=UPI0030CB5348